MSSSYFWCSTLFAAARCLLQCVVCCSTLFATVRCLPWCIVFCSTVTAVVQRSPQYTICYSALFAAVHYLPHYLFCCSTLFAAVHRMPQDVGCCCTSCCAALFHMPELFNGVPIFLYAAAFSEVLNHAVQLYCTAAFDNSAELYCVGLYSILLCGRILLCRSNFLFLGSLLYRQGEQCSAAAQCCHNAVCGLVG